MIPFKERKRKANPVKLSRFIHSVVDDLGFGTDIRLEKLKKNWNIIVGPVNARNTIPLTLKDEILTVSVSSPAWITQARFYVSSFIEKINGYDPGDGIVLKDIRFIIER